MALLPLAAIDPELPDPPPAAPVATVPLAPVGPWPVSPDPPLLVVAPAEIVLPVLPAAAAAPALPCEPLLPLLLGVLLEHPPTHNAAANNKPGRDSRNVMSQNITRREVVPRFRSQRQNAMSMESGPIIPR